MRVARDILGFAWPILIGQLAVMAFAFGPGAVAGAAALGHRHADPGVSATLAATGQSPAEVYELVSAYLRTLTLALPAALLFRALYAFRGAQR